jgi:hypothetical protein
MWRNCGEGPWDTEAEAIAFQQAEVGATSRVRETTGGWIVEVAAEPTFIEVGASIYDEEGGSDGAYDLIFNRTTPEDFCEALLSVLNSDWGLTNSDNDTVTLSIQIKRIPAGK